MAVRAKLHAGGHAPATAGMPGEASCRVFDGPPLAQRLKRAGVGLALCACLGDVSEFHAAARYALSVSPPVACSAVDELFVYTDGSASPPSESRSATRGWAAVFVGRCGSGFHFLGALFHEMAGSGTVIQHDPVGDSNTMELAAILWALVWVVVTCPPHSVCIVSDSLFAINATQALWGWGGHSDLAGLCAALLLVARGTSCVRFEHVRGHDCNPFNELADCLAKRASLGVSSALPEALCSALVADSRMSWEWIHSLDPARRSAYPDLRDGAFVFAEERSGVDPARLVPAARGEPEAADVLASLRFGSFNVCTLGEHVGRSRFVEGRPALIRRQVRELGVHLLGVQEARTAAGSRLVDGYVVLASGADCGTLGCELWADTTVPYATLGGKDFHFRLADFVAIFASPRLLIVRVTARRVQCTVVVAHAPHSGEAHAVRDLWWAELVRRLAGQRDVVLLVDANGRVGSCLSRSVGPGGFSQAEDDNGALFHRSLAGLGLCLPATFGPIDREAFTWVSRAGICHRIDYVAVPCSWGCDPRGSGRFDVAPRVARAPGGSCEVHVVDAAGDWEDHALVTMTVSVTVKRAQVAVAWRPPGVDRAALRDPAKCAEFREAIKAVSPVPWSVSVDVHERTASEAVCKAARDVFGPPARRPYREHIDDCAWGLVCDRRTVKTWCRERRVSSATRGIVPKPPPGPLGVYLWASCRTTPSYLGASVYAWLASCAASLVDGECGDCPPLWDALGAFLRHSGKVLRGHLKSASAWFLEATAVELDAAQGNRAHDLAWQKLRSLTCRGGAKWKGARALPGRIGEDGVHATDASEVAGVVLRHFAGIEAAEVCTVEALADRHASSAPCLAAGATRDIDNVCDLVSLRRLFARAKRGKACGLDGVRDDYCAIAPAEMADLFHPLLTKCALRVQEPLAHKGGIAVDLWKRAGDQLLMKFYRSLLLNSVIQKHHYRFMRGRLMVLLGAVFLDSQCGGFRGKGTTLAALGVRGFLAATRAARVSAMTLFVDLKSGFYTVVRELVCRLQTSADDLERVLESVSAPKQLEPALLALLAEPSIVEQYMGDSHLGALLSEAHTNTWFVVDGIRDVARAVKGSRPGCCLADFVFNVCFAPALREVRAALLAAGFLWPTPHAPAVFSVDVAGPAGGAPRAHPTSDACSDFTYADDSCFCCVLRRNVGVADTVLRVCRTVADVLIARGMVVNWDRAKSAAVVVLRGPLSKAGRRELPIDHDARVPIPGTDCVVHIVRSYVHLGSDVCGNGSMGPAVAARVRAHAQAMVPLRRCVCPRKAVSVKAKLIFVDALATSRLCHSVGAWDRLAHGQLAKMQASLVGGYRCALALPHRDPTRDRHVGAEVLAAAGRFGVDLRLSVARLRLLVTVLLRGPHAVHLLFDYLAARGEGWPQLVKEDLDLVHRYWGEGPPGGGLPCPSG